jgi:seryl-tRNA synthetase
MLEITTVRNHTATVREALAKKNFKELHLIDEVIVLDEKRRSTQKQLDDNLAHQNAIAKEIGDLFKQGKKDEADTKKAETAQLKEQSKLLDSALQQTEEEIRQILVTIPNTPHTSVPVGKTPEENEVVKQHISQKENLMVILLS